MSDALAIADRPERKRIDYLTPRVRQAVDLMVWDGLPFNEAATKAGLHVRSMRLALDKPHVLAYMRKQKQVLLVSDGPRRIRRYVAISEAADNMPAVAALDRLQAMDEGDPRFGHSSQASVNPGVTIILQQSGHADQGQGVTIDGKSSPTPAIPDKSAR